MRVITESKLRSELGRTAPAFYRVPEGTLLTPAAREYLKLKKIKVIPSGSPANAQGQGRSSCPAGPAEKAGSKGKRPGSVPSSPAGYTDYATGKPLSEKPEEMTALEGNRLVKKDYPRIIFRGKLDSLQALLVLDQTLFREMDGLERVVKDLEEVLGFLREMMRCEVLGEAFLYGVLLGLNSGQLREHSHHPYEQYGVQPMRLPSVDMGKGYALLNQLRTAAREAEIAAVTAFGPEGDCPRTDITEGLNRLSSAFHIMMCKLQAGVYAEHKDGTHSEVSVAEHKDRTH